YRLCPHVPKGLPGTRRPRNFHAIVVADRSGATGQTARPGRGYVSKVAVGCSYTCANRAGSCGDLSFGASHLDGTGRPSWSAEARGRARGKVDGRGAWQSCLSDVEVRVELSRAGAGRALAGFTAVDDADLLVVTSSSWTQTPRRSARLTGHCRPRGRCDRLICSGVVPDRTRHSPGRDTHVVGRAATTVGDVLAW